MIIFLIGQICKTLELSLTFSPMEKLKDYTLEIIVMDKDRIGRNECIGKVRQLTLFFNSMFKTQVILGHKGSSLERQHWRDMISRLFF